MDYCTCLADITGGWFVGYWDHFFSSSIYSGNNRHLVIYIKNSAAVPPELLPFVNYSKSWFQDVHSYINVTEWCFAELNVPPPPEERISEAIELQFKKSISICNLYFITDNLYLIFSFSLSFNPVQPLAF